MQPSLFLPKPKEFQNKLAEVNAGVNGSTSTFANDVYATNTNIGAGTVDIKGNLTGAVNSTSAGVGTLTTTGDLTVNSTGKFKIAVGTTAQRPASPVAGDMRLNTSL